jgi:hopene-associated glycosyltransferase HpnB
MILTGLAALPVLLWLYLLLFHGRFWRADQRLTAADGAVALDSWPAVVAVIPARNEAASIAVSITALLKSSYPGPLRVVLVDDGSDDGTASLARQAAADVGRQDALTVTAAPPLPAGWSGKLWAVQHGLDVARAFPEARYVLLTDADIVLAPDTLARLVAKAVREGRALVSLLARLDDRGPWAGLLIPAFAFFFQKLYPFPWVNDPRRRTAAAAGGCLLVEHSALEVEGGVAPVRHELIDDCALARRIKGNPPQRSLWIGLTREVVSLRDNRRLGDIWDMVARTAYTQLRYSPVLLVGTVAGLALLYLLGPLLFLTWPLHTQAAPGLLGLLTWGLMAFAYAPTLRLYARPAWQGADLPVAALLYALMTITSAYRHGRGRGGRWKGRTYSAIGST